MMDDPVQIYADVEQGSPEWFELRRGIPTASNFGKLMVKTEAQKGRATYLYRLAGERITGEPAKSFVNEYMEIGKEMEPQILHDYSFGGGEVQRVGFILNGKCGCSPDGLVDDDGMVEAKKAEPHILGPMLEKLRADPSYVPSVHFWQCQGNLMVADRAWIDLIVYAHPKMRRLKVRVHRDDARISELRDEIDRFDLELRRLTERLR